MERAFSGHPQLQLHLRALEWCTQVTLGFSPFYIPVLFLCLPFFILVEVLSLIFTSVEVPPLIFYLGNTICFRLKRELHAR